MAVELALADVTVEITLARLADAVRRRRTAGNEAARALPVEIERRADPSAPFPLMPLQQEYFVGQHDGWELSYESAHFYADFVLAGLDGEEAAEALEDALARLALHQPMLRARITPQGEQYVLAPDMPGAIPRPRVYDLREAGPQEGASAGRPARDAQHRAEPARRAWPGHPAQPPAGRARAVAHGRELFRMSHST
ncbi:hypothetical protein [Nonomuraea terrae]|uniref:hypothetical protein n=1 Tax=Nonomuraea terrae TaxID=2530383 RepID=UPI001652A1F9|nr:hypothetical protein [Nonomuraea terrae]